MANDNTTVLPDDPNWKEPIVMGDAYDGKTPKTAQEKLIKEHSEGEQSGLFKYAASTIAHHPDPWMKTAQMSGVNTMMTNPMWFSPLHTPQNWQIASKRREVYQWNRFWYDNEPKVAAAIDFYSRFPMNGFRLECPSKKILSFFEHHIVKKLKLNEVFKMISSEYFMLGDVFIHLNVSCPKCKGTGIDPETGDRCDHKGGIYNRIVILNPDWIEVQQSPLVDEPQIVLNPDEELKNIVFYKQPKAIYDRIPDFIKKLVIQGKPIPLSNRTTHHLKHMPVPYGTYGTSLIRRLFTTLAYKTKIMTANWIVAERLILPVRVVKVGNDNRPATTADIADIQQQLGATANDPNLTIVTHHAFEYEWYGATGKILQVTQELDWIGKEILDGFMLNQSLLNGEMCIPEQDRMLTKDGFKSLQQITKDDEIATFNKETGMLEYQKPSKIHVYNYNGDLIHFQNDHLDFACTPNHKMLFQNRRSNEWLVDIASKVTNEARFRKTVDWWDAPRNTYPNLTIGGRSIPFNDVLKIIAYYVMEDHVQKVTRKNSPMYGLPEIVQIAQTDKSKGCDINNKNLAKWISEECGRLIHNKRLPQWVKMCDKSTLKLLLHYMINSNGVIRTRDNGTEKQYTYFTKSNKLRDDIVEISLKCGYSPSFRKRRYMWEITFSDYDLRVENIPLESKKHNTITNLPYKGKVWCVTVPNGFIITERNGKLMVSGNSGYQSAQVGVETLIRRIESWRHTLAEWAEENIFKPIAEMQGFIDEEKSAEIGEKIFLYPTIKWNDLELKDKTQWHQLLIQLHDKQVISTQTLMEELHLNYDQEIKRMRYEQMQSVPGLAPTGIGGAGGIPIVDGASGIGAPGGGGGGGGVVGGAAPGAEIPGMGGDMGMGGMGSMGGAGGDMGGGADAGAMGMAAGDHMKVMKKGKGENKKEEKPPVQTAFVKLTKIEQKMAAMLEDVAETVKLNPANIRAQFPVDNPKGGKRYQLDFAIPILKIGIECDGEVWHSTQEQEISDKERDYLLAQRGWTILRFDDKVIEDAPHAVKQTINKYIRDSMSRKGKKSAEVTNDIHLFSYASGHVVDLGTQYEKYFANQTMHKSAQIGMRDNWQNIQYKNST